MDYDTATATELNDEAEFLLWTRPHGNCARDERDMLAYVLQEVADLLDERHVSNPDQRAKDFLVTTLAALPTGQRTMAITVAYNACRDTNASAAYLASRAANGLPHHRTIFEEELASIPSPQLPSTPLTAHDRQDHKPSCMHHKGARERADP